MQARRKAAARNALAWVVLEVLLALAIAFGIVWWTFPKKPAPDEEGGAPRDDR